MLGSVIASALAVPAFSCSFSETSPSFTPVNYKGNTPLVCRVVDGAEVAEVTCVKKSDTMWGIKTKPFKVTAGHEFLTLFVMSGNLPAEGGSPGAKIVWLNDDGSPLTAQDPFGQIVSVSTPLRSVAARRDARGVSRIYSKGLVPAGAVKAMISMEVDGPNLKPGERVFFHVVDYYEHPADGGSPFGDIDGPVLRLLGKSPSDSPQEPIRFKLEDESGVDARETRLTVDGAAVDLSSLERDGDVYVYAPSEEWKMDSIHRIEVDAVDVRGNASYDCAFMSYTRRTRSHPKASVRDDGMILLDGKPFFPLGWFRVRPCEGNGYDIARGIAEMKANGMNMAHTYMVYGAGSERESEIFDELVAACEKYGVALYCEPSSRKPRNAGRFYPLATRNLLKGLGYRMPLFWGIGDDTSTHLSPDEEKILYRCCKSVDPDALTVSVDVATGPTGHIPYAPYVDVLFLENYTIKNPTPANDELALSQKRLDDAWAATIASKVPNRSVVAVPQCFKGWNAWKRIPSEDEIRAQAYLSIAQRARGLVYYASCGNRRHVPPPAGETEELTSFGPWNVPELKKSFYRVTREIAKMIPSLVKRDAAVQPRVSVISGPERNVCGGASVRCLLKEDGLLVAANSSHLPVSAVISLPDGTTISHVFPRNGVLGKRVRLAAKTDVIREAVDRALRHPHPRLFADDETLAAVKRLSEESKDAARLRALVSRRAKSILSEPLLERVMTGRRMLSVSNAALGRILALALSWRLDRDASSRDRAIAELKNVCSFSDWNPSHFLDTAVMSLAVAIGYDWLYSDMDEPTRIAVREGFARNGLEPISAGGAWVRVPTNWGQTCNAGAIATALALMDAYPGKAASLIARSVDGIRPSMSVYAPKGGYPEGPGYWSGGTLYSAVAIALLESVLKSDFGLTDMPGFMATGSYIELMTGPTRKVFNYSDAGFARRDRPNPAIWWLSWRNKAPEALVPVEMDVMRGMLDADSEKISSWLPLTLLWWQDAPEKAVNPLPLAWESGGMTPVAVQRSGWGPNDLFVGLKAGRPGHTHGHQDAGSFVLDACGVRWAEDLGPDDYHAIEQQIGMGLWDRSQSGARWKVFRINVRSHNTIMIGEDDQNVEGSARIISVMTNGAASVVSLDLSPVYPQVNRIVRRGEISGDGAWYRLTDEIDGVPPGTNVRWAMMTRADARVDGDAVLLELDGRRLRIEREVSVGASSWKVAENVHGASFENPNKGFRQLSFTAAAPAMRLSVKFIPESSL